MSFIEQCLLLVNDFTQTMNAPTINADNSKKFLKVFSSWNYDHQNFEMKFWMKVCIIENIIS